MSSVPFRAACCLVLAFGLLCSSARAATINIAVQNNFFSPANPTINVGDTVVWTWPAGSQGHNVVCQSGEPMCGDGTIRNGPFSTAGFQFNTPGDFPYYCDPHRLVGMSGTIKVVGEVNNAPAIGGIPGQVINTNTSTSAISFNVSDTETPSASLSVSADSSNLTVMPLNRISFGGSGGTRTITLTSGTITGNSTITVTVTDGGGRTATSQFLITVFANNPPQITSPTTFPAVTINQGGTAGPIPFTIVDANSPASSLVVFGTSGNQTLVPNANITFTGTDSARTNFVTPAAGQFGTALITINVSDGSVTNSKSYTLTVNSPPLLNITSPLNGSSTNFPAVISVSGTSTDPDGTIGPVVYYMNNAPVRTNSGASFQFTLTNLIAGTYGFKSVATDNRSATATSSVATVTINPFTMTTPVITTSQAQFSYAANPGLTYIVQGSSNLTNWTGIVTNTASSSSESFTDNTITGQAFKFYRVIQVPSP